MTASDCRILREYLARTPRSAQLAEQAREVIPGGVVTDTRYFEPYGIYVDRAEGATKWDVDGNAYLDFFGGHGANILGHAPQPVVRALLETVVRGSQFAANHPAEVALAQEVKGLMPQLERVRFTASGTEATLLALRLARAFTGRTRIVRFSSNYHGWHDHAISGYVDGFDGSPAAGVLREIAAKTVLLKPGDTASLARLVEEDGADIAAFIIEPVGTHFGIVPVTPGFLAAVQQAAHSAGALFILDEVLSGFRVALGGAQQLYGLTPDLTTLGKIVCGGMPGGAVGGRADVLSLLDLDRARRGDRPKVLHQGTFTANPASMAAGLAMLKTLARDDVHGRINALGARARALLNEVSRAERLPFRWYGEFSGFHLLMAAEPGGVDYFAQALETIPLEGFLAKRPMLLNRLRMALNLLGIDLNTRCSGLLCAAHTEADLQRVAEALARAGTMLRADGYLPR
jgi:glutamate-1-semialdehyde 2,1-aminomutase